MQELEQIRITQYGIAPIDAAAIDKAEEFVPACRLASIENTKNRIEMKLDPGSRFGCCAQ